MTARAEESTASSTPPPPAAAPGPPPGSADAALAAWVASLPALAALLLGVAGVVPQLTRALRRSPAPADALVLAWSHAGRPEPGELALYLVALVVPALVAWAIAGIVARPGARRRGALPLAAAAVAAQALWVVAIAWVGAYQHRHVHAYFGPWRWALGVAMAAALAWAWRKARALRADAPGPGRLGRASAFAVAAAATLALLSTAVFDADGAMALPTTVGAHVPYTLAEFAAVLNGRTLWVDFYPMYVTVLPYLLAPALGVVGLDVRAFTLAMAALSLVGLMLQYDVLRRVTRNAWVALALYLPFVGFSFYPSEVAPDGAVATAFSYFAHAPLRYFFPWVVGWLLVRYLEEPGGARRFLLLAVASVGALNNVEFGVPALGAAAATVLLAGGRPLLPRPAEALRAAVTLALGAAAALLALQLVTFARSGRLLDVTQLTFFPRLFAVVGYYMLPMPPAGLHWIVYGTYMAGLFAALFRLGALGALERAGAPGAGGRDERVLAGAVLFASVFGAGALATYVGRSHFAVLIGSFPAWGFVLMLLCWAAARPPPGRARAWWASAIPAGLAIAAYGLCAGEALPLPRATLDLYADQPGLRADRVLPLAEAERLAGLVRTVASPGEKVMITSVGGHLIAELAGVDNVYPLHDMDTCFTTGLVQVIADRARVARVTKIFGPVWPELHRKFYAQRMQVVQYDWPPTAALEAWRAGGAGPGGR